MLAARAHRIDKFLMANAALVRHVVVLRDDVFVLVGGGVVARLEFLVHLPAVFVVGAVVHEFAGVAETAVARLFVVLNKYTKKQLKCINQKVRTSNFNIHWCSGCGLRKKPIYIRNGFETCVTINYHNEHN